MQPLYIKLLYRLEKLKARLARSKMPETPAPLYICAIFKNEAAFLVEWVEFHLAQGVDHLFLIDNFSSDNFREVLLPYLKSGQVTLLQTKHRGMSTRLQALAYNRAVRHIQKHHNPRSWVTFIDIDEYLFSVSDLTIKQILQSFSAPPRPERCWSIG